MKNNLSTVLKTTIAVTVFAVMLSSCQKNEIVDTVYPSQTVYMSQAATAVLGPGANGIYTITAKVEGQDFRFKADVAAGKFNIPLGVIRSGIELDGNVLVNIGANNDTVNKLITGSIFAVPTDPLITTELLPATAYTVPATLEVPDGKTNADFTVAVDLPFLVNSAATTPKKRYAFAVTISGVSGKAQSSKLNTVVVLINPVQVITPVSNFTSFVSAAIKTATFNNLSSNAVSYSWNFGDGTPAETTALPSHIFTASGTYTVTLTATGIAGSGPASIKTASVVIP